MTYNKGMIKTYATCFGRLALLVGSGDNLQPFISPLLKYEEWLYNIIDDNNFEISSL